jgi:hypothetical protein
MRRFEQYAPRMMIFVDVEVQIMRIGAIGKKM